MTFSKLAFPGRIAAFASLLALLAGLFGPVAQAASEPTSVEEVSANLRKVVPGFTIDEIAASPVPGVFEVISEGQIYYVGEKGRYLFEGNLIDLQTRENLTIERQSGIAMAELSKMDESDMLIFEPGQQSDAMGKSAENSSEKSSQVGSGKSAKGEEGEEDASSDARTITVFTDTSCPYCSRLHEEIGALSDANIRVRYLLYPRAGLDSDAAKQLESVWCSDDPQNAMTIAKEGGQVPSKTCDNPIASHIEMAQKVGLQGTPMIFLDDGEVIPGYQPASELIRMIESSSPL